jgi:hypothetical protein
MFSRWRAQRAGVSSLTRYWDELVSGERSLASDDGLDVTWKETVHEVRRRYAAQPADPTFSATLLSHLTALHAGAMLQQSDPLRVVDAQPNTANGRAQRPRLPVAERQRRPISGRLIFTAVSVTLLVLAGLLAAEAIGLSAGDSLFEDADVIHTANNAGEEPAVVLIANLLTAGEPVSTFLEDGTPTP